ncbi:MAG: DUF6249 domain-containing protein [Bacteroidales bacterium]
MTDFITIPAVVGICVYGFYKFVELLAHRRERLQMVEKIDDISTTSNVNMEKIFGTKSDEGSRFTALRIGSVLAGIGLGLLVGFIIALCAYGAAWTNSNSFDNAYYVRQTIGTIYAASTLTFGGIALLVCFIIEQKYRREERDSKK